MKPKKLLAFVWAAVMIISLLPVCTLSVLAETTQKNITLGTAALSSGNTVNQRYVHIYYGKYPQSSDGASSYSIDPIGWRVLDTAFDYNGDAVSGETDNTTSLFLLSANNLDRQPFNETLGVATWANSTIRTWLNRTYGYGFYSMAFSEKEKAYILKSNYDNLSNDKIFLLSEAELYNKKYFTTDRQWRAQNTDYTKASSSNGAADTEGWWLRSVNTNGWTGYITGSDIVGSIMYTNKYVNIKVPVRPAFNLNSASILFTSAAKGGKTKMASGLLENAAYSGVIYKLTMKDSSRKFTIKQHNETINVIDTAESIELNYSKAQTGDNEFISAMIVKNNEVLYYGQLAEVTAASGKVKFTIPSDIEGGVYELRLFNEQINGTNGNYATDFSSDFETVTLNVEKKVPQASDFTFKAPNNLIYDGSSKTASVVSNKRGMGTVNVKYYDENGNEVAPINVGTYTVKIDVEEGKNYLSADNLTGLGVNAWKFTVSRKEITNDNAVITLGDSLIYSGEEQTQEISRVEVDGLTLKKDDYTVSNNKGTNAGDGYVLTITGNGNFTGSATKSFEIEKAVPTENPGNKTTARVRRGRALADATVTNGEILGLNGVVLDGTFDWVDNTKTMSADGTEQMIFTPADTNYAHITIDVAVNTYSSGSSGTSRYTVKFNTNGGNSITSQTVKKNDTATEPEEPTNAGYIFDGWYIDSKFITEYDFDTAVTKSITLYAKWVKDEAAEPSDDIKNDEQETIEDKWKNPYNDVCSDDWFYEYIKYVDENGLMNGISSEAFAPNDNITRGMFVTVLYRAEGEPAVNKSIPFADVSSDMYCARAVIWAEQNDIVNGIVETEFAAFENITREQIAAMLYRYAKYKGYDVTQGGMQIREFEDFENISDYAVNAVTWAVNKSMIKGKNEKALNPKDNATRAETAAMISRFIEENK